MKRRYGYWRETRRFYNDGALAKQGWKEQDKVGQSLSRLSARRSSMSNTAALLFYSTNAMYEEFCK